MAELTVNGWEIEVVRKPIKNLHLAVYPPSGRIRIAAPIFVTDEAVRLAIISRIAWIKRQQERFWKQERMSPREYVTGESHYYLGRRYRLEVVETTGRSLISLRGRTWIQMRVHTGAGMADRERALKSWYRRRLRALIPAMLAKWQPVVGAEVDDWGIKEMRTKWGSCSRGAGRIWLNLSLARLPERCIEYVVVHELAHLRERNHGAAFQAIMDAVMPRWREIKTLITSYPLVDER